MKYAKGKHPNSLKALNPIKPGEVRNPNGARSHNKLKRLTLGGLTEIIEAAAIGNLEYLQSIVQNPDSEALRVGVAKSLYEAIKRGDWAIIERMMERVLGRVPIKIESENINANVELSEEELKLRLEQNLKKLKMIE